MESEKLLRLVYETVKKKCETKDLKEDLLDLTEAIVENRFIVARWQKDSPPKLFYILKEAFPNNTHPIWNYIPLFGEEK